MISPESRAPANWRNGPERTKFSTRTIGVLSNPGTVVFFRGAYWLKQDNDQLRPPTPEERDDIRKHFIEGHLTLPNRPTTKALK